MRESEKMKGENTGNNFNDAVRCFELLLEFVYGEIETSDFIFHQFTLQLIVSFQKLFPPFVLFVMFQHSCSL